MSLRKQARILGIAPSYLSMLVNGKRKWPDDLRYRYSELVNSVVNTEGQKTYKITGAQERIRTPTPDKGKRILSPVLNVCHCLHACAPFPQISR